MEKILELYKYVDGVNDSPFPNIEEQLIVREFRYDAKRMGGAPTISFTAMHRLCLDNLWSKDVYAMFNGERYYLKQTPTSSYGNSDTRYKHEVELISERSVLDNIYFYDVVTDNTNVDKPVSNSSKFTFFGDIHEYVNRLDYSLRWSNVDYTIIVDEGVFSEEKQVTFEDQVVTNALQEIYNIYQIPYYFVGKVIHVGEYQNNIDHVFKYGATNSLLSISKNNANAKIVNRITGVGSQDNIPYYYPNDDEKGVTIPLLNGSSSGVSISNQSRYRKVRLSDKFVFHSTIQTQTPLIDSSLYILGDLTFDKKEEGKDAQYSVDFYYTFSLKQGENVLFNVSADDENTVDLQYEIYKLSGNHLGYFRGSNNISLTGGTYNFIIRWTFLNPNVMFGVEEELESLISSKLKISSNIVVDAQQTWTLKNIPVILENYGLSVDNPSDGDIISIQQVDYINPQTFLMPSIYRTSKGHERFYNAENEEYKNHYGEYYVFENEYSKNHPSEHIENFEDIKPTIKNVTNSSGLRIDRFVDFAYDLYDNDEVDEEGKFIHKWFFAKLNKFDGENGFNLFDHSIDESEMIISMTSGSCGSCSFKILVDKDTQKNTVQVDESGNLLRDSNGNVRFGSPQDVQNDTENNEVWIALEKDIETFGVLMPNATNKYRPSIGDTFVILHIDLPKSYITAAEKRLEEKLIEYMYENNFEKFNFSISFSRIFFAEHPNVLNGLNENSKITIEYNGYEYSLYASSISISMTNGQPLPEIKVELNDTISISQNQISQIVESTKRDILSKTNKDVFWGDIKGIPSWIGSEKPRYSYSELTGHSVVESSNDIWSIKKDEQGISYIYTKFDIVTQKGVTMYADGDKINLPAIYSGLPIDGITIIRDENGVLMLNPNIELGGSGLDEEELKAFLSNENYAKKSDIPSLNGYATESWVAGKNYVNATTLSSELAKYVPISGDTDILGLKNFTKGLLIDGLSITKSQDDVVYIDANLVVRGGITMYGTNSVDVGSIYDGLPIDGATIYWDGKVLKAKQTESGIDENFLVSYLTSNNYAKKSDIPSLVGYATQSWVEGKKYLTGITSALVTTALGYTPLKNHQALYALTIQKNGTNIDTYTPNSAKKTINIVVPTKVSELDNDEEYATTSDLDSRINTLINGAPTAFDTLKEIADVLQGNVNSIGDIIITLGTKADKSIKISAGTGISGGGTLEADRTLSLATSGVTVGTYKSVTVDKYGRVTSGTNPTTLAGYGITDVYTKSAVDTLLNGYVTLATKQDITGEKNFKGGLKVNGSPIVYDSTNKYWKLEGDLLVTGGITMFGSDSDFKPSTIMDGVVVDGVTIRKNPTSGALEFIGSINVGIASSVDWENVENKPLWIGSSKPVYSWNEITSKPTFASVATSGKYSDLSGRPTFATVATSGSYNDLSNKPTSLMSPYSLTFGSKTYDGSAAKTITASDLGALTTHQTIYALTIKNSGGTTQVTYTPNSKAGSLTLTKSMVGLGDVTNLAASEYFTALSSDTTNAVSITIGGTSKNITVATMKTSLGLGSLAYKSSLGKSDVGLGNVENTALSSWAGTNKITTLGTITTGTWNGTKIANAYLANSAISISGTSVSLGGSITQAGLRTALGLGSAAYKDASGSWGISVSGSSASCTGNAASATQLKTPRTIWGQSFDGTGNVSGALSGATTGSFSSNVTVGGALGVTGDTTLSKKLTLNGIPIYKSQDDVLYIDGNLVVRGGITMYGTNSVDVPTIMDAIATDNVNLKVVDGVLTFVDSSGGLSEVHWDDVIGRPTLLSSFIDDVVDGHYLPLSGGQMTGNIGYTFDRDLVYEVGIPAAGKLGYTNFHNMLVNNKSFMASAYNQNDGSWCNVLSLRHANGGYDGNKYGMYIYAPMTSTVNDNLYWGRQVNGTWMGERVILDSVNWSQYVTAADGGRYLPLSGGTLTSGVRLDAAANIYLQTNSGNNWNVFSNSGNRAFCVEASGYVGIGRAYDAGKTYKLAVDGNEYISGYTRNQALAGNGSYARIYLSDYYQALGENWEFELASDYYGNNVCTTGGFTHGVYFRGGRSGFDNFIFLDSSGNPIARISASNTGMNHHFFGDFLVTGGITMYSDIRKKTKLQDVELNLQQIADAPLIEHYYNSDEMRTTHVGSIAQYWASMNDWFCKLDGEGYYTMEIQNAALASAISIARELQRYESKTDKKIRLLKKRIGELEEEIEKLKMA